VENEKKLMEPVARTEPQQPQILPAPTRILPPGEVPVETAAGATANVYAKFAIGLLAGFSAVLLPRLLALLSKSEDAHVVFFPLSDVLLAAGVGVFLGLVMLVLEYQVAARPKETFMAALGIPALISGALGTASGVDSAAQAAGDAERLRREVRLEQGIGKDSVRTFGSIEPAGSPAPARPGAGTSSLPMSLIGTAHADDGRIAQAGAADGVRFGVRVEQPKYVVVLKQTATEQQAIQEAQKLQASLPAARAVRADGGYFVILGSSPAGETDALLAATRAKKLNRELQPLLVQVRK
jgi:hypothetical protein